MATDWGPLDALVGEWHGAEGCDLVYSPARGAAVRTRYREHVTFEPFGPVVNGDQRLFGLDYRAAMWRGDETLAFHHEVGYWLWDAERRAVLKAFAVPRGITVLAGGMCEADSVQFTLTSGGRDPGLTIGENLYLRGRASSLQYELTVHVERDDTWNYHQTTVLEFGELAEPFAHTDVNHLSRVTSSSLG